MGSSAAPRVMLQVGTELPPGLPGRENLAECLTFALGVILERSRMAEARGCVELSVSLVDEEDIRTLNRKHRQKDAPTDVLSFPLLGEDGAELEESRALDGPPLALGDVVLCPEVIARQAVERGIGVHERFAECLVHGVLHLMGFEHSSKEGLDRMGEEEDELVPEVARLIDPEVG